MLARRAPRQGAKVVGPRGRPREGVDLGRREGLALQRGRDQPAPHPKLLRPRLRDAARHARRGHSPNFARLVRLARPPGVSRRARADVVQEALPGIERGAAPCGGARGASSEPPSRARRPLRALPPLHSGRGTWAGVAGLGAAVDAHDARLVHHHAVLGSVPYLGEGEDTHGESAARGREPAALQASPAS